MRYFAALFFIVVAASVAAPARAEMCSGEYQPGARRLSKDELARENARRAEERERAEAAERARQAAEEAERHALALRRAALPPGMRLIEDRCTACHSAATLAGERRGWLGWWAVVLRMEVLNGARFAAGDRKVIVDYLAEHQGAGRVRVVLEWIAAVGVVALAPLAWFGWRAASRRRARAS
jgi:hypothetical protein